MYDDPVAPADIDTVLLPLVRQRAVPEAVTLNEAVCPSETVRLAGFDVTVGAVAPDVVALLSVTSSKKYTSPFASYECEREHQASIARVAREVPGRELDREGLPRRRQIEHPASTGHSSCRATRASSTLTATSCPVLEYALKVSVYCVPGSSTNRGWYSWTFDPCVMMPMRAAYVLARAPGVLLVDTSPRHSCRKATALVPLSKP